MVAETVQFKVDIKDRQTFLSDKSILKSVQIFLDLPPIHSFEFTMALKMVTYDYPHTTVTVSPWLRD